MVQYPENRWAKSGLQPGRPPKMLGPRPKKGYQRRHRRDEIMGAQAAIKRFAAKLPAAQNITHIGELTNLETAQALFLDSLRTARRRQNLTQSQLAAKVGTSQVTIARIESAKVNPKLDTLFRIAEALGLNIYAD